MSEKIFFDCNPDQDELTHLDIGSAVDYHLDGISPDLWPAKLKVYAWKSVKVPEGYLKNLMLEYALETLDEGFGGPDFETEPTDAMKLAEAAFIAAIMADYTPYRCERSPADDDVVDVAAWVREFSPEWLDEEPVRTALAGLEETHD